MTPEDVPPLIRPRAVMAVESPGIRFLKICMKTEIMQEAKKFLVENNSAPLDDDEFLGEVYRIWFTQFKRGGRDETLTCGFQHVFIGEARFREERKWMVCTIGSRGTTGRTRMTMIRPILMDIIQKKRRYALA